MTDAVHEALAKQAATDLMPLVREFMGVLDPEGKYPVPTVQITNQAGVNWLGRCKWETQGEGTTCTSVRSVLQIQRSVLKDETSLRRVTSHEVVHHIAACEMMIGKTNEEIQALWKQDGGHGPKFLEVADRINQVYGAGFVTVTSDETYRIQHREVNLFLVAQAGADAKMEWCWSTTVPQKIVDTLIEWRKLGHYVFILRTASPELVIPQAKAPNWKTVEFRPELGALNAAIKTQPNLFPDYASRVLQPTQVKKRWTLVLANPNRYGSPRYSDWPQQINAWACPRPLSEAEKGAIAQILEYGVVIRYRSMVGENDLFDVLPKFNAGTAASSPGLIPPAVMEQWVQDRLQGHWPSAKQEQPVKSASGDPLQAWFAGSKITDVVGNPLRVYHGTARDWGMGDYFSTGQGGYIYVTPDPHYTENFNHGHGGRTFALYAKAHRPLDLRSLGEGPVSRADLSAQCTGFQVPFGDESALYKAVFQWVKLRGFKEACEDAGYDAIWLREHAGNGDADALLLFDPHQLKSATGNRGTFDAEDPRIVASGDPLATAIRSVYRGQQLFKIMEDFGPFDGGCLIMARAILQAAGQGELVRLTSPTRGRTAQTEHYGAMVHGKIYDAAGGFPTPDAWIDYFKREEHYEGPLHFEKGEDPDREHSEIPDDPHRSALISALLQAAMPMQRRAALKQGKQRTIYLDMDGVLADYDKGAREAGVGLDEFHATKGAFSNLDLLPGALEALKKLQATDWRVCLLSKPSDKRPEEAAQEKIEWAAKMLPFIDKRDIYLTDDKSKHGTEDDILVDDHPEWANAENFKGTVIKFTGPETWEEVMTTIKKTPKAAGFWDADSERYNSREDRYRAGEVQRDLRLYFNRMLNSLQVQPGGQNMTLRQFLIHNPITSLFTSTDRSVRLMGNKIRAELLAYLKQNFTPQQIQQFEQEHGTNVTDWIAKKVVAKKAALFTKR